MERRLTKDLINQISYEIIGGAIEVHKELGPGLLESSYEKALLHELKIRGLKTNSQQKVQIPYKGIILAEDLRYDILVEDFIIVENKATLEIHPVFVATLLSYIEHMKKPKGILLNFNVKNLFKEGQQTFVNRYFANLPEK